MTQIERVAELLSTPGGQDNFLKWAGSEITQLMLGAAKELARPQAPPTTDSGTVAITLGKTLGATAVIEYLITPFRLQVEDLVASGYGVEEILKEDGYGDV